MNEIEQRLSADLRETATGLVVPAATTPADLRARGDAVTRFRTRAALGGLAAAAVVAAIATGLVLDRGGDPQITPAPAPTYREDGVPYVLDGRLYVAHREQREPGLWSTPDTVGRYTRVYNLDTETTLFLRDSEEVYRTQLITGPSIVSADGVAAWVQEFGPDGILTAYDLETGRTLTRARIAIPRGEGEDADTEAIELTSVDADGTVHYQLFYAVGDGYDRAWEVGPGAPARPRHDPEGAGPITPDQDDLPPAGYPDGVHASLSPDHLQGAWLTGARGTVVEEDPTGPAPTYAGLTVQAPDDPGSRFTIPIPPTTGSGFATWSDLTHVELVFRDARDLTCDVVAKKCRTADRDY